MAIDKRKLKIGKKYAKHLREKATPAERRFKKLLQGIRKEYDLKFHYRFQKCWLEGEAFFISDFYFPKTRKTIELDGSHHYHDAKQLKQDALKERYLKSLHISTLRISNSAIFYMKNSDLLEFLVKNGVI